MMSENYYTADSCLYCLRYHLVWSPRFEFGILKDGEGIIRQAVADVCRQYGYEILALNVRQEYIHLFLSTKPTVAPADAIRVLKSITAALLLNDFPQLKKFYGLYGSLWEKEYLVSTALRLGTETIHKFLEQKKRR